MQRGTWSPGQRLLTGGMVAMITAIGFEGLAVPTILPDTLDDLGGLALYGWAFSGFWLANLLGIVLAGAESDRRGPMRPFLAGTAAFAAGLVIAAAAPSMAVVVVGRLVQGLGAGAISSVVYVVIARGYDPAARPRMIAIVSSAWVVPGLVGPGLAGIVSQSLSWRWVFGGLAPLLPLAAIAVAVSLRHLAVAPDAVTAPPGRGRTVGDAVLLTAGVGMLLGAGTINLPLASIPLAVVGLAIALRSLARLLPAGSLTARPGRGAGVAAVALISAAFLGAEAFVPLAVSSVRGAGVVAGGLALTAAALTWSSGSWIQERWAAGGARRLPCAVGFALVAMGIGIEILVPLSSVPIWVAPAGWAVGGLGMGIAYSMLALVTVEAAPPGEEGAASAAMQIANTLGVAVGSGAAGAIVSSMAAGGPGLAPGIAVADVILAMVAAAGILVSRRIPEPRAPASRDGLPAPEPSP